MLSILMILAVRCLLVMLFLPFSALDKVLNYRQAVDQAALAIKSRPLAALLIVVGFGVEVLMSLGILTGLFDRFAAFILGGYCIVTALLWKQFWKADDFRLKGVSRGRDIFWDFWKNIALAGGFLILAVGPDAGAVRQFWHHPLASSHPYSLRASAVAP